MKTAVRPQTPLFPAPSGGVFRRKAGTTRNQNLPGMGGVYNLVNLHVYHYAGNDPVKYTDPTGLSSGYVNDSDAVAGMGHAGMYVELENGGFAFFEVAGLPDSAEPGKPIPGEGKNTLVLSNSALVAPTVRTAGSINKPTSAGAMRRDFATKEDMLAYLATAGSDGGYDEIVGFSTTKEQDASILNSAMAMGERFSGYAVLGNSCGIWAKGVLTAPGSGISGRPSSPLLQLDNSFLGGLYFSNSPNAIGANLLLSNPSAQYRRISK